jgi:hypothetical protein
MSAAKIEFSSLSPTSRIADLRAFVQQNGLGVKATSCALLYERIKAALGHDGTTAAAVVAPPRALPVATASDSSPESTVVVAPLPRTAARALSTRSELLPIVQVWEERGGVDIYTRRAEKEFLPTDILHIDHIIEVQLINAAFDKAPVAWHTRESPSYARVRGVCNDVSNLNVTLARVNQMKKGPFVRFLNARKADKKLTFDDAVEGTVSSDESGHARRMREEGVWDNIRAAVEVTARLVKSRLPLYTPSKNASVRIYQEIADEFAGMMCDLEINCD